MAAGNWNHTCLWLDPQVLIAHHDACVPKEPSGSCAGYPQQQEERAAVHQPVYHRNKRRSQVTRCQQEDRCSPQIGLRKLSRIISEIRTNHIILSSEPPLCLSELLFTFIAAPNARVRHVLGLFPCHRSDDQHQVHT